MVSKQPLSETKGEVVFMNPSIKETPGPFRYANEGDSLFVNINDTLLNFRFKGIAFGNTFKIIGRKSNHAKTEYLISPLLKYRLNIFSYHALNHIVIVNNNGSGKVYSVSDRKLEDRHVLSWK
jgi:hypothetical protein